MSSKQHLAVLSFLSLGITAAVSVDAYAQVQWYGVYSFEAKVGGSDSKSTLNNLPNGNPQLIVNQFQLFLESDIGDHGAVHAKIGNNAAESFDLKTLEFQLAYLEFSNIAGSALNLAIGKILTPFGTFAKRQLPHDNPLMSEPLYFSYPVSVSPSYGYVPGSTPGSSSNYGDKLMTMWTGGYTTGLEAFGSLFRGGLSYDLALTNAPISATAVDWNTNKELALQGRIGFKPAIWIDGGFSFSYGSYMDAASAGASIPADRVDDYKQRTLGADVRIGYLYYELNAEYVYNTFDTPSYQLASGTYGQYTETTILPSSEDRSLPSYELVIDAKAETPFLPGFYVAGRADILVFGRGSYKLSAPQHGSFRWENDVDRYAAAFGYSITRDVRIKAEHNWMNISGSPNLDLQVFALQLSVTF